MNRMTSASSLSPDEGLSLPASAPASARVVLGLLKRIRVGWLDVQLPDGSTARFGQVRADGPHVPRAGLRLHDWRVCSAVLKSGDIGFAEGYIDGHWTTPDLTALIKLIFMSTGGTP